MTHILFFFLIWDGNPHNCGVMTIVIIHDVKLWKYFEDIPRESEYFLHNLSTHLLQFNIKSPNKIFSSPEPKARVSYCRPFSSVVRRASCVVRRPSSVNFLHFHLLLENAWLDFNQTWQESSLGVGDSKLFK